VCTRRGFDALQLKTQLVLSETEREQLKALTLRRKTAQAVELRASTLSSLFTSCVTLPIKRAAPRPGSAAATLMVSLWTSRPT
jgi:hypothetical protein